ncbi:glycoside hydrolase family 2 protein [Belliella marina]|uniref:Glycoside hydrolase family 2 protein n=1 Tax=Belliella marina TaxID=1644146 RepID=A0ABW4VHS0_9BACT
MNPKYQLKPFLVIILFVCNALMLSAQQQDKKIFNENWQFQLVDTDWEGVQSLENGWRQLDLPHDWSIEGPFSPEWASGTGFLPAGVAWYKKEFSIESYDKEKVYSIYFDGVYKNSEVWINGHYLGKRPFGFIPFQYDLTSFLKAGDNTIHVKVDHRNFADARYYTGSGIYRNVYLITSNQIHFAQWGVFFHTPEVNSSFAKAVVEIEVEQNQKPSSELRLKAIISDKDGKKVGESYQEFTAKKGKSDPLKLELTIPNPNLWSPDQPYLYTLAVELWEADSQLDSWKEKVGVRTFDFDANKGFTLNGESMLLKGVCIHHDAGGFGAAVPKEVWRNRLETLKKLGSNAIRMSHYPHQDYMYELCDEMGFLVQDEAFDEWEIGKNKWIEGWNAGTPGNDRHHDAFEEWAVRDVEDMVRRNRNRPSIIMWSIGNEIDYPNDPYSHPVLDEGRNPQIYGKGYQPDNPAASNLGRISEKLAKAVKRWDTSRPVTAALAGVAMSNHTEYPSNLDIVGYNYQEYRYAEDHKEFPERVIYGSENGDALEAWLAVSENDFISSQFLWTAFDFIGEARPWPSRSSGAGIIDLAGNPKPDYYFRQSLWTEEPMVYLGVTDSERQVLRRIGISNTWNGQTGEPRWVTAYTNADEVELFLNGRSLGKKNGQYSVEEMIAWEVPYEKGDLKAIAFIDGNKVAEYTLESPGDLKKIEGELSETAYTNKGDVIELNLWLTDGAGNLIEDNDVSLSVDIDGPAEIIVMESGDLSSHEPYHSATRKTYQGRLKTFIRTLDDKGELKFVVKSSSLPEKIFSINSK